MSKRLQAVLWLTLGVGIAPLILTSYGITLATEVLIMAILAMSLGLIMGYAGMVSLGHAAFFGIGAYTVAILGPVLQNVYALILIAMLLCSVVALLSGAIFIRTSHFYFLMITLAFGQLLFALFWQLKTWTGGADGMKVSATLDLGFGEIISPLGMYFVMAVAFLLIYIVLRLFVHSPAGRIIKGVMENESRMKALGYNVRFYKLLAYTISGAIAGFSGSLYAYFNLFASPDLSYWMFSGQILIMVIIGGVGTLLGPAIGAGLFIILQNYISSYTERWPMIMGILIVALVLAGRGGVAHWLTYFRSKLRRGAKDKDASMSQDKEEVSG
jgi:branched-chain amino acid transport system permease protein